MVLLLDVGHDILVVGWCKRMDVQVEEALLVGEALHEGSLVAVEPPGSPLCFHLAR